MKCVRLNEIHEYGNIARSYACISYASYVAIRLTIEIKTYMAVVIDKRENAYF